jgi:hypothetical protein
MVGLAQRKPIQRLAESPSCNDDSRGADSILDRRAESDEKNRIEATMTKQARKHAIGLAGEFLVAGELLRRGVAASVTYGNAKKADVIAIHEGKHIVLEIKSTSEDKWVLGGSLPDTSAKLWVLVYLSSDETQSPEYFVVASHELRELLLPEHERFMQRHREKHGKEFAGAGVVSIRRELLTAAHGAAWHKVKRAVGLEAD